MIKIKKNNRKQGAKFESKNKILILLKNNPLNINELESNLNLSIWTIYHHLQDLKKAGKIKKVPINGFTFKYALV